MNVPMYRVAGIKHLSKNVQYPFTDCMGADGIIYWTNDAIEHAKIVAKKIAQSNENSAVSVVENDNDTECIYHVKVTDNSTKTDMADIFVYPITVSADKESSFGEYIFTYRGMNYDSRTNEVNASGFIFSRVSSLDEAFMFIDSFLFACSLQQTDNEG